MSQVIGDISINNSGKRPSLQQESSLLCMQVSEGLAFFQPEPTLQGRSACCVWQGRYPPTFCMCWGFPGLQNTPPHGPEPTLRVWMCFFSKSVLQGMNTRGRMQQWAKTTQCVSVCVGEGWWSLCCAVSTPTSVMLSFFVRTEASGDRRGEGPWAKMPPSFPSSSPQSLGILNLSPGFMKIYLLPRRLEHVLYHSLLVWLITFTCLDKGYVGLAFLPWAL